jgi:hypothetical protein
LPLTWVGDDVSKVRRWWGVPHGDRLLWQLCQLPHALIITLPELADHSHATLHRRLGAAGELLLLARQHSGALEKAHFVICECVRDSKAAFVGTNKLSDVLSL